MLLGILHEHFWLFFTQLNPCIFLRVWCWTEVHAFSISWKYRKLLSTVFVMPYAFSYSWKNIVTYSQQFFVQKIVQKNLCKFFFYGKIQIINNSPSKNIPIINPRKFVLHYGALLQNFSERNATSTHLHPILPRNIAGRAGCRHLTRGKLFPRVRWRRPARPAMYLGTMRCRWVEVTPLPKAFGSKGGIYIQSSVYNLTKNLAKGVFHFF
jgi:hypothetical protein